MYMLDYEQNKDTVITYMFTLKSAVMPPTGIRRKW